MFRTTLVHLAPDASLAAADYGTREIGNLYPGEARALLERFRTLDATANAKADPEIIFETRRRKHIVRTGQGRLHLYDPRDILEPALILSVDEIIAELDGTAAAARTRPPFPVASLEPEGVPVTPAPPPRTTLRRPHRLALGLASLGLAGYLGSAALPPVLPSPALGFEPVADALESAGYRADYAGVYMTGQQPGDRGLALASDGTMKFFQLNAQGTPSLLQDTFRVGRIDGQLCALGTQSEWPVRLTSRTTAEFGGETYRRLP